MTRLIDEAKFTLIASVIRKDILKNQYAWPENPYHLAMQFGLERIARHDSLSENAPTLHVVCESRGNKEDNDLELAFRRLCARDGLGGRWPMEIVFAKKHGNFLGLELADQVARPIGRHVLNPNQKNRAYDVIDKKFRRSPDGKVEGWGLKCFLQSKTPRLLTEALHRPRIPSPTLWLWVWIQFLSSRPVLWQSAYPLDLVPNARPSRAGGMLTSDSISFSSKEVSGPIQGYNRNQLLQAKCTQVIFAYFEPIDIQMLTAAF